MTAICRIDSTWTNLRATVDTDDSKIRSLVGQYLNLSTPNCLAHRGKAAATACLFQWIPVAQGKYKIEGGWWIYGSGTGLLRRCARHVKMSWYAPANP